MEILGPDSTQQYNLGAGFLRADGPTLEGKLGDSKQEGTG